MAIPKTAPVEKAKPSKRRKEAQQKQEPVKSVMEEGDVPLVLHEKLTSETMILVAMKVLARSGGTSIQAIKGYISNNYSIEFPASNAYLKQGIESAIEKGMIVRQSGTGLTGSFSLPQKAKTSSTPVPEDGKKLARNPVDENIKVNAQQQTKLAVKIKSKPKRVRKEKAASQETQAKARLNDDTLEDDLYQSNSEPGKTDDALEADKPYQPKRVHRCRFRQVSFYREEINYELVDIQKTEIEMESFADISKIPDNAAGDPVLEGNDHENKKIKDQDEQGGESQHIQWEDEVKPAQMIFRTRLQHLQRKHTELSCNMVSSDQKYQIRKCANDEDSGLIQRDSNQKYFRGYIDVERCILYEYVPKVALAESKL